MAHVKIVQAKTAYEKNYTDKNDAGKNGGVI